MRRAVRVYFDKPTNLHRDRLVGQVRRLADEFGRLGIVGKRGQTNRQVRKQGFLRVVWPSRRQAIAFQDAVDEFWGHLVSTRRFRLS